MRVMMRLDHDHLRASCVAVSSVLLSAAFSCPFTSSFITSSAQDEPHPSRSSASPHPITTTSVQTHFPILRVVSLPPFDIMTFTFSYLAYTLFLNIVTLVKKEVSPDLNDYFYDCKAVSK